jgi:hypothetical protein
MFSDIVDVRFIRNIAVKDRKILEAQQEKDQTILQVQCNIMFFSGLMNEDGCHYFTF